MTTKRDLVIIGAYPNNKLSQNVLIDCIERLHGMFDIVLSTHYPVDLGVQKLVEYYVYDSHNELIEENDNPVVWFGNDTFYLQTKHLKNYAYSAYSCMTNGARLLQNEYEYFYYINGDTLIGPQDIDKLLKLKQTMLKAGKRAVFFKEFSGMVDSKMFLSETKFFIDTIAVVNTKNEFIQYTKKFSHPYIPYVLESFFSERIDGWSNNKVHVINVNLEKYFDNSQIDVLISFNGRSETRRDYVTYLVKEKTSDRIFFVYTNNTPEFEKKSIHVKINGDEFTLNNGNYWMYKEAFPDNGCISLEVEGVSNTYNTADILSNSDSYIQFN